MMEIIIDSCSLINLINGNVIDKVLNLPNIKFYIGPLVQSECCDNNLDQKLIVDQLLLSRTLNILDDVYDIAEFNSKKIKFNLGDGETESILLANKLQCLISSDDRAARTRAVDELGKPRVIGSLYLLRELVINKLINCEESINIYFLMKQKGGFLPVVDSSYLCK